ncbi:GDP-L-fucose synthase family protein [Prochlorococcus marinus]|uniref:GDP-L-fucose synthase family protein n=1 Tax=Prochlorococcus marinus TaxID=1219 RepID=UPI0022B3021B|nr:GDP-L-fucose synthase [Prochlorococcus marinus]
MNLTLKTIDSIELINKEESIFVAGHRGMVGSAICRSFNRNGFKNLLTIDRRNLDLLNSQLVDAWFQKYRPSIVVLAAAKVGGIEANRSFPVDFILNNLQIQNNVINASWKYGVKRLLFLGSSCIYPKFSEQPIKEEALLTGPLEPTNEWYAIAKITGLKLCQALRKQYNFDAITLMPTNLYGPGDNYHKDNSHVLPAMIRRFYEAYKRGDDSVTCWGTGTPLREFLHVDDLGDACLFALRFWKPESINAPTFLNGQKLSYLNIGTGVDLKIKELAEIIAEKIGFSGSIKWDNSKPDGTPKKQLDVSRIMSLGWKPKISLEKGIDHTLKDFHNQIINQNIRE